MQIFFHLKLILSVLYRTQITLLLQQKLNNKEGEMLHIKITITASGGN